MVITTLIARYNELLITRPLITKTLSTAMIIGLGDIVSQLFDHFNATHNEADDDDEEEDTMSGMTQRGASVRPKQARPFSWDAIRTLKMFSWGIIVGPSLHGWYLTLERLFPVAASTTALSAVKKLAVDQLLFAPLSLFCFLSYMGFASGKSWENETKPKIEKDMMPTLVVVRYQVEKH